MSIFGWSYPPGCNGTPFDDDDETCEVCGARDLDKCVCPTCRECGQQGDPACYYELANSKGIYRRNPPHRHMTAEQHRARGEAEVREKKEAEYWDARAEQEAQAEALADHAKRREYELHMEESE